MKKHLKKQVNKEPVRKGGICRADDESAARHVTEKER